MVSKRSRCGVDYDYSFKVLLVGDSSVGKSSLLLSFVSNCQEFHQDLGPTIGTDFGGFCLIVPVLVRFSVECGWSDD